MRPLRRVMRKLEGLSLSTSGGDADAAPHAPVKLDPISVEDLQGALKVTKPSAVQYGNQYVEFSTKYGVVA